MNFSFSMNKQFFIFWTDVADSLVAADSASTLDEALDIARLRVLFSSDVGEALITDTKYAQAHGETKQTHKVIWIDQEVITFRQLPYSKWERV